MKKLVFIALLTTTLSGCFVTTAIKGNGTVTSPDTGNFNCATGQVGDCQQAYTSAGSETLKATADPGHTFAKWSNCTHETLETCAVSWPQGAADGPDTWPIQATFKEQSPPVQAAQYTYNALGQRMTKKVGDQVTIFQYDLDGKLMAEIDAATGQPLREHIHINGEPLAQLTTHPGNGKTSVHYIHAIDHLGTPTLLTDQSGNVVADIEATPFGETYIDYAEVTHNRRFPGQYRDGETGLHYNYFRDYDPSLGRYIQSDPIGLQGGLNTYAYVENNPIISYDQYGLCPWCWGAAAGVAMDFWGQMALNGWNAKCIDWGDVAMAGALGAVNPFGLANLSKGLRYGSKANVQFDRAMKSKRGSRIFKRHRQREQGHRGRAANEFLKFFAPEAGLFAAQQATKPPCDEDCTQN